MGGISVVRGDDNAYGGVTTTLKTFEIQVQNNTASTVIGGTDTLDVATLGATLKTMLRTNKTINVVAVQIAREAVVGGTAYGGLAAMSSTTLQITPKASSDHSTNATLPANTSTTQAPYTVRITAYES